MASNPQCKEMASVSPAGVRQRLTAFFANMACDVFDEFQEPNTAPDETRVKDELVTPLQWLLCGGEPAKVFGSLEEHQSQSNFCGKVFRSGEPAYFCKECQTDPTCCLCMECFEHSEHKNHHYRLFASGGGGCCDCGDPEAWTSFVHCDIHKPDEEEGPEVDPVEVLPPDLANRARPFFSALLWYCMDMLCWEDAHSLPEPVTQGKTSESLTRPTFMSFLYNDEDHSYDEVIFTLTSNLRKTHTDAVALATFVDRKGRAVAKCGTEEECLESKELINTDLGSGVPLKVMVFHSAVAAHQTNAILCLSLLKELAEKLDAFRRLISEALVEVSNSAGCCVLDRFFLCDSKMWITARIGWHRLVMSSIFMDPKWKPRLAINLTKNYPELQKNFVEDSHHHDVCASNMTVQLFTVPSLSRMLVTNHGLLQKIVSTLTQLVSPCQDPNTGVLKLTSSTYNHSRISYIMFDLRYILRNKPDDLSGMHQPVLEAFQLFLDLLGMVQNAGQVKRQHGVHVEREEPWENTFNFLIVLQQPLLLFIDWCTSDPYLLREAVKLTVKKHEEVSKKARLQYRRHEVSQMLVGRDKMELYVFDVQKESISVHQPLPRVLAGLLAGASAHGMSLSDLLQMHASDTQTPLFLMEYSSRVLVMAVQVLAGMWKRNGYSVFRQVVTYQYNYPREMMYDKDIVMLQAMASLLEPSVFLYALIYKFRLDTWLARPGCDPSSQRGENSEDALRFFLSEAEEFVFLLITIFCERFVKGVGENVTTSDTLKREIIHKLFISSLPHSQILKEFRMNENENEIDRLLKEVATLRKGGGMNRSVFVLKAEYEKEYNPFHYHYSRTDHSMAEDARRKKMKSSGPGMVTPQSATPKQPPPFCHPFQGIMRLTTCPIIHRIFHCVFQQAADAESKFWSDRLLYEALYLCAMMLQEADPTHHQSLCNAAIGRHGANQFLDALSTLLTSRRAEEHKPLLTWVIKFLKKHRDEGTGRHSPPPEAEEKMEPDQPQENEARKELAKEKRKRVMAQMQNMQRKFLEKNKEHMDEVQGRDEVDSGTPQPFVTSPTVRAVGVESLLSRVAEPKEVTCILCQAETKDFASQEKVLVQAVHVQRSCVLKRGEGSDEKNTDFLAAHANLALGMYTSGCGHHVHAECWTRFIESKRQEHGRRHFFPLPGQSVQWATGEFLCPLCQCFSNTVIPLLPPFSSTISLQRPLYEVRFSEWRDIVRLAVELAVSDEDPLQYTSTSPTLWDKLQELFSNFRKPSAYYQKSAKEMASVMGIFTQSTYMRAFKTDPDEANERVCVAEWNNCAHTISSLQLSAKQQGKFLLSILSPRQVDYLSSLAKMGCDPKLRPQLKQLGSHVKKLINSFLLESPPFGELPSIVEIDTFSMMVYLHFAVVSLLAALVSPSGCLDDSPILPALIGVTMVQVVRTATAAHLVQYLLCYPPGMDTGDASGKVGEGAALQKLWVNFRHQANLPSDTPPDSSILLSNVRDYLDPFLQCAVLFFHSFTGISFVQPEDKSLLFSEMCQFLNIPTELHTLFEEPARAYRYSVKDLASLWCEHNQLLDIVREAPILLQPRSVIDLPKNFTELVNKASRFKCPNHVVDGDDGQAAMLCLLCGKMLCTNSYCCMFEVEDSSQPGKKPLRIGGFTHHSQSCSGGLGMALWILEAYVVLLDATDLHHVKGCTLTPPYLDEYGESDPGLRRGIPLHLHEESMQDLRQIWFQHRVPEKITQEMESNRGLMRITWSRM